MGPTVRDSVAAKVSLNNTYKHGFVRLRNGVVLPATTETAEKNLQNQVGTRPRRNYRTRENATN